MQTLRFRPHATTMPTFLSSVSKENTNFRIFFLFDDKKSSMTTKWRLVILSSHLRDYSNPQVILETKEKTRRNSR